mgnify:FL=1
MKPPISHELFQKLRPHSNVTAREYARAEKQRLDKDDVHQGEILRTYQRRESGLFAAHDSYIYDKPQHLSGRALVSIVLNYDGGMVVSQLHLDEDKFIYANPTSVTPAGFFSDFDSNGQPSGFSASEFNEFQRSLSLDNELIGVQ